MKDQSPYLSLISGFISKVKSISYNQSCRLKSRISKLWSKLNFLPVLVIKVVYRISTSKYWALNKVIIAVFELSILQSQNVIYFSIILLPKNLHIIYYFPKTKLCAKHKKPYINSIYIVKIMFVK